MFYGYEKTFQSIEHLEQAIVDYINYYNNKRIKIKLKKDNFLSLTMELKLFFIKYLDILDKW